MTVVVVTGRLVLELCTLHGWAYVLGLAEADDLWWPSAVRVLGWLILIEATAGCCAGIEYIEGRRYATVLGCWAMAHLALLRWGFNGLRSLGWSVYDRVHVPVITLPKSVRANAAIVSIRPAHVELPDEQDWAAS